MEARPLAIGVIAVIAAFTVAFGAAKATTSSTTPVSAGAGAEVIDLPAPAAIDVVEVGGAMPALKSAPVRRKQPAKRKKSTAKRPSSSTSAPSTGSPSTPKPATPAPSAPQPSTPAPRPPAPKPQPKKPAPKVEGEI